jgi:spore coat polysaccharide biosynthesis protein SpsF
MEKFSDSLARPDRVENLVVIQARMGSERLPGKSMLKIGEQFLIEHVLNRAIAIEADKLIVVATTNLQEDDVLANFVENNFSVEAFRGDPLDVRSRFASLVLKYQPVNIVRLTADDPFKDPKLAEEALSNLAEFGHDYVSNFSPQCLPIGLDVEAFTAEAFKDSLTRFQDHQNIEHVTPGLRNSGFYRTNSLGYKSSLADFRLTIDYPEDLQKCQEIYQILIECNKQNVFDFEVICEVIQMAKEMRRV